MSAGNGVMCLNFRPGKYPDTVSFELQQFAVTNPGTVTVYDEDNNVLDIQGFGSSSSLVSVSGLGAIARIEIGNAHAFSLDDLSWSGVIDDGAYMKTIDFENDPHGPVSGNYGVVQFRTLAGYECGTGNAGDGTSPLNGAGCLVLDGGNPNNEPDDGCSNSVHGVAVAGNGDQNFAGTMGAFFHPAARPTVVSFDLRQFAVTGPVNITAFDALGGLVFSDTMSSNSESVLVKSSAGIDHLIIEGLYPFTVDDFAMSGIGADIPCIADLTNDGTLDIFDVFAYLDLFNAGCP
ncbi:MAG: hypothetical protein KC996_10730 [Phycisphaerales bacterium]|nr:hypothetical protein [Phycisphaerales bacterium]